MSWNFYVTKSQYKPTVLHTWGGNRRWELKLCKSVSMEGCVQVKSINSLALSFLYSPTLSHPYKTTEKTIALIRWTFVGKVMSLFFDMLSRLVITFLPRSKCLWISWLQSSSAVILEPKKIRSVNVSIVSPFICHDFPQCNINYYSTHSVCFNS